MQAGFRKAYRTSDHLFTLQTVILESDCKVLLCINVKFADSNELSNTFANHFYYNKCLFCLKVSVRLAHGLHCIGNAYHCLR